MKKIIAISFSVLLLSSCKTKHNDITAFTDVSDTSIQERCNDTSIWGDEIERVRNTNWDELVSQADLNLKSIIDANDIFDSIKKLSEYIFKQSSCSILLNDNKAWNNYAKTMENCKKAFLMIDDNSSAPMTMSDFEIDYANQRLISLVDIYNYHKDMKDILPKHGLVSNKRINDAYSTFISAAEHDCWYEDWNDTIIAKMVSALHNEHKAWTAWINQREKTSQQLDGEIKEIYINSTNELKRAKLIQLLNQYNGYGIESNDVWETILHSNCTDKQLNSYPGFSAKWKVHLDTLGFPCTTH